jgi:phage-related protein
VTSNITVIKLIYFLLLVALWGNIYYFCMQKIRTVVFYKRYFLDFFQTQKPKVKGKILWTIGLIEALPRVPENYLKHLEGTDGLYEIRVQTGSDIFRLFCFFDEGQLVILLNAFQKKSQKTPSKEIERALRIKKEYEQKK